MTNKKYKERYVTTIPFERNVFDYVKKNLPKGVEVADEINKFMLETMERLEKEKNLNSPNYSAIKEPDRYISYISNDKQNTTLDIYLLSKHDIVKHIDTIEDVKTLAEIEDKGKTIHNVAKTRKLEILPLVKFKKELEEMNNKYA